LLEGFNSFRDGFACRVDLGEKIPLFYPVITMVVSGNVSQIVIQQLQGSADLAKRGPISFELVRLRRLFRHSWMDYQITEPRIKAYPTIGNRGSRSLYNTDPQSDKKL
jgi:hypothetical protein